MLCHFWNYTLPIFALKVSLNKIAIRITNANTQRPRLIGPPLGPFTTGLKCSTSNVNLKTRWTFLGVDSIKIGLIGSMYFAGWTVSCLFVPRFGDVYGRKLPILVSAIFSCVCYLALILSRNLLLTIFLFFLLGMTCSAKGAMSYVYLLEFIPIKYQNYVGSLMHFFDGSIAIFVCLYFRYISKTWTFLQYFGLDLSWLSTLCFFFVPESPKFLESNK